jgi:virginiamycin B lyase
MIADTMTATSASDVSAVTEYPLAWPGAPSVIEPMSGGSGMPMDPSACCIPGGGSTHELVFDPNGGREFWVSGQKYDHLARIDLNGNATYFPMPIGSAPHGSAFDARGRLWVTFEDLGQLAQIRPDGTVARTIDVSIRSDQFRFPLNPHPHGLTISRDGMLWFTGKLSNTIGRVDPERDAAVTHFALPTPGAVPIYVVEGPDGTMWCTELGGSCIGRIAPDGTVAETRIPTPNSRPITIRVGPDGRSMWFTEEAGGRIGRIDIADSETVIEYPVPLTHRDAILAGHVFDADGNLWVQQYVPPPEAGPTGDDYIVRIDKAIVDAPPGDLSGVAITFFKAPSQRTVMHRITVGPDDGIWFSELGLNRIGKVIP